MWTKRRQRHQDWTAERASAEFDGFCARIGDLFPDVAGRFHYRSDTQQAWVDALSADDLPSLGMHIGVVPHPDEPFAVMLGPFLLARFDDPVVALDHLLYYVIPVLQFADDHVNMFGFPCHTQCDTCE